MTNDWSEDFVEVEPTVKRLFKAFNEKDFKAAEIYSALLADLAHGLLRSAIKENVKQRAQK